MHYAYCIGLCSGKVEKETDLLYPTYICIYIYMYKAE